MNINVQLLTRNTKNKARKVLQSSLEAGTLQIIVGTHALLNATIRFKDLGLVVIDEQHRFGVAQRAKWWEKDQACWPHMLVMTATPIPRTLAMTLYGDLDVSVIDEMPTGRKPIQTLHCRDAHRLRVFQLLKEQLLAGRQAYVVYPLVEESEKLVYKNLVEGYESICRAFPGVPVSIVHGQMNMADKEYEMQRFARGNTKIMVATTVIEVGIDVSNATFIIIENAERFGLAQLHQLRGRVGRGSEQSYCVLMTSNQLNEKSKERIQAMVRTNDGFEIADTDLKLRGPGDLLGVQQSGALELRVADLAKDQKILQVAREAAQYLLEEDPLLEQPQHLPVKNHLVRAQKRSLYWSSVG